MVAFGRPVVPEVKASRATSSADVATSSNSAGLPSASAPRSPVAPKVAVRRSGMAAFCRSSVSRASQSATVGRHISAIVASSPARSSGIVVTATPPAFRTANQHATSQGSLNPRSSTRLPGTSPRSSVRTAAIRLAAARRSP
jgi:hypothetical protein